MIFAFLSLCFASTPTPTISLKSIPPEQFAETVFKHVQDGANTSLKTFNTFAILRDKFATRFEEKDPRTPHIVLDGEKPIGVILFGYWGSGETQKEHWDLLPYGPDTYNKFDEIVQATLAWYAVRETRSMLILSFHPERCDNCLTLENGWTAKEGEADKQTVAWADPKKRSELALEGVVGPLGTSAANVADRVHFTRSLRNVAATAS